MGKSLRWSENLWCMNPLHTVCPRRITREEYIRKHCRNGHKGGGRCPFLFIDRKKELNEK
jgi:hypothetical protein